MAEALFRVRGGRGETRFGVISAQYRTCLAQLTAEKRGRCQYWGADAKRGGGRRSCWEKRKACSRRATPHGMFHGFTPPAKTFPPSGFPKLPKRVLAGVQTPSDFL